MHETNSNRDTCYTRFEYSCQYLRRHIWEHSQTLPALPQWQSYSLLEATNVAASWCVITETNNCSMKNYSLIPQFQGITFILQCIQCTCKLIRQNTSPCKHTALIETHLSKGVDIRNETLDQDIKSITTNVWIFRDWNQLYCLKSRTKHGPNIPQCVIKHTCS